MSSESGRLTAFDFAARLAPTVAAITLAGYVGAAAVGPAAGALTALSLVFAAVAGWAWPGHARVDLVSIGLAVLLGGLAVFFAFKAGGFFPGSTALMAASVLLLLALRIALSKRPLSGVGWLLGLATGALLLLALWQVVTAGWSDGLARALLEADRTLLYLGILAVFGSFTRTRTRLRWLVRGLALALLAVCLVGLAVSLFPDRFPVPPSFIPNRLSFPLTYWNTLGLMAVVGGLLAFHMATGEQQPPLLRVAGAMATPIFATTLYLTFSRGAVAVGVLGLLIYLVLALRLQVILAAVAALPTAGFAVWSASRADALASATSSAGEAAADGRTLGLALLACVGVAGLLRAALLPADGRLSEITLSREARVSAVGRDCRPCGRRCAPGRCSRCDLRRRPLR